MNFAELMKLTVALENLIFFIKVILLSFCNLYPDIDFKQPSYLGVAGPSHCREHNVLKIVSNASKFSYY